LSHKPTLDQKHFEIFTNWISQRAIGRYYFKLLYRHSRDGFTAATFHQMCDNKEATIVVAEITNSEQIDGLYWDSIQLWKNPNDVLYSRLQIKITFEPK
jgi:hypothetical protein